MFKKSHLAGIAVFAAAAHGQEGPPYPLPDQPIRIFEEADINVVVVGGETNGYWQMMGARHMATVSVDAWR